MGRRKRQRPALDRPGESTSKVSAGNAGTHGTGARSTLSTVTYGLGVKLEEVIVDLASNGRDLEQCLEILSDELDDAILRVAARRMASVP